MDIATIAHLFRYNSTTGHVFRRSDNKDISLNKPNKYHGYIEICVTLNGNQSTVRLHRVAYYLMTGHQPRCLDHIDRDKTNNKWSNLREATVSQNNKNRPLSKNNKSGIKGVGWFQPKTIWNTKGRWYVQANNKAIGSCYDFFEACCMRKSAENRDGEIY